MRSVLLLVCLACLTSAAVPAGGESLALDARGPHTGGDAPAPAAEAPGQRLSTTLVAHEAQVSGSFEVAVLDADLAGTTSNYTRAGRLATFCRQLHGPIADLRERQAAAVEAHQAGDLDGPVLRSRLVTIEARATTLESMADSAGERADALPRRAIMDAGLDPGCFDRHAEASARIAANASEHLNEDDGEDREESVIIDGDDDPDAPWGVHDFDPDADGAEYGRHDGRTRENGSDDGWDGDRSDGERERWEAPQPNGSDDVDHDHHHGWLGAHGDWHEDGAGWNDSGGYPSAWTDPDGGANWSDSRFDPNATGPDDVSDGWNGTRGGGASGPTDGDSNAAGPWGDPPDGDGFGDGPESGPGGNWSGDPWAPDANHSEDWGHDGSWDGSGGGSFEDGDWNGTDGNWSGGWGQDPTGDDGDGDATAWDGRDDESSSNDTADDGTGEWGDGPPSDGTWGGDGGSWNDGDEETQDGGWGDGGHWGGEGPYDGP